MLITPTLSATGKPSTNKQLAPSVWSRNSPKEVTWALSSTHIVNESNRSLRRRYGDCQSRWSTPSRHCTRRTFSIGTSSQPTSSWQKTSNKWRSETWTYPFWARVEWPLLKLEHLITQVPRCGRICRTMENVIFGRWVVWFIRWLRNVPPLWLTTWIHWEKRLLQVNTRGFQRITHKI